MKKLLPILTLLTLGCSNPNKLTTSTMFTIDNRIHITVKTYTQKEWNEFTLLEKYNITNSLKSSKDTVYSIEIK